MEPGTVGYSVRTPGLPCPTLSWQIGPAWFGGRASGDVPDSASTTKTRSSSPSTSDPFVMSVGGGAGAFALGAEAGAQGNVDARPVTQPRRTGIAGGTGVDPRPMFEISAFLYMQFMEPLGSTDGSVKASWDYDRDDWREDFVEATGVFNRHRGTHGIQVQGRRPASM
jgi:hypothetical protein